MRGARISSLSPLQVAIYERLTKDQALMDRITGVFDDVGEKQPFPYITFGETTVIDWSTKTQYGEEVSSELHIWSEHGGKKEAMEIMSLVVRSISLEPIRFDRFIVLFSRMDFMHVFDDPDPNIKHGVIRFLSRIFQEVV